jgi:molybdopterin-guanine dinucleotide biosynthesis protein A
VVVLACDLPCATPAGVLEVLNPLVADPHLGAVVPVTDRLEPLHAAYRRSVVAAPVADAFASGVRSIHRALTDVPVGTVRLSDPTWLHNANSPADLPR